MWTFNKLALIALLLVLSASLAAGDSPFGGLSGGGMVAGSGISNGGGFTGTAPVSCGTGAINFSTGCTQGMFGGL